MAWPADRDLQALAERFCAAPLPASVCSDLAATIPNYPHARFGTHLLTVEEAKVVLRYVLETGPDGARAS